MELLTYEQMTSKERMDKVKSQKAVALFDAVKGFETYTVPRDWPVPHAIPILLTDLPIHIESAGQMAGYPCFLRTCPLTPRHGVLESVRSDTPEELQTNFERLRDSMLEHDPEGNIMLMPFVAADNSAVVALSHGPFVEVPTDNGGTKEVASFQGYAVLGPGHDGVTAGHGLQLGFPLRVDKGDVHSDNNILTTLNRSPTEHELEFVFSVNHPEQYRSRGMYDLAKTGTHWLTQIRGAPSHSPVAPPPEGVDIIGMVPQGEMVVKEFILMSGLEEVAWLEENITKEKCPDGFMVVEPGGSRLSHIYAHCRGVGVPYVITNSVSEGDRWVEAAPGWVVMDNDSKFTPKPYKPASFIDDFRRGVEAGNLYWRKQQGWFATFFHQWLSLPMSKPQDTAYLAGVFSAWLPKAILALGMGEMRHAQSLKRNANAELFATMSACVGTDVWEEITGQPQLSTTRKHYYAAIEHLELDWGGVAKMLTFLNKHFKAGWPSSYGGNAWAVSMEKGAPLATALDNFLTDTNEDTLNELSLAVNVAENCVHNNGFLFNKWLSKRAFDTGTGGFSPRKDIANMAAAHLMASEILNPTEDMVPAKPPTNDWHEILDFVMKRTPTYWRNNPIGISPKVPEILRETAQQMQAHYRHGERGPHNNYSGKDFIMCGVASCGICANHLAWGANNPNEVPHLVAVQAMFSNDASVLMFTPAKLDVWLVGEETETRLSVKQKVALIKAKEFNPSPQEFADIYNALDPMDKDHSDMMLVLNKWMAKKGDDLPDFLQALSKADTGEWTAETKKDVKE